MLGPLFSWPAVSVYVAVLIGLGASMMSMSPPEFQVSKVCFSIAAFMLLVKFGLWVVTIQSSVWERGIIALLVFGLIGAGWAESIRWVQSREPKPTNISAPFSVEIVTWSGKIPNDPSGVGFWIVKKDQNVTRMSQADIAVFLQIVNLKPFVSQLSSYSIDIKIHGKWHRTIKMIADYASIFFVPPGGNFNHAYPAKLDTFFDHVVMGRSFQAHEPMRGWVLLQYGDGTESLSDGEKPEFRVSLSDAAGVSFRSDILKAKGRQTNEDAQSAIVFHEGNRTADISHVRIERWIDH